MLQFGFMKLLQQSHMLKYQRNWLRKLSSSIKVSRVDPDNHKMVSDFLLDNFYKHEPIGKALGLNVDKEVRDWFPKYVSENLAHSPAVSSQATDEQTGKVVGINFAIIVDPKQSRPPAMLDFVDAVTQPVKYQICVFLDEIEEGLNAPELLGIKSLSTNTDPSVLDNLKLSVSSAYQGQGITSELIKKTEYLARKIKGCLAAKVVVTSEYSYNAFIKQNYQLIREFQYEKYKNPDGVHIFGGKEPQLGVHHASRVLIKDLSL